MLVCAKRFDPAVFLGESWSAAEEDARAERLAGIDVSAITLATCPKREEELPTGEHCLALLKSVGRLAIGVCVTLMAVAGAAAADPLPPAMQAALDAHNAYRAKHCVPPLTWSDALAASAQQWASRCDFNHDDRSPHGENLFWGTAGAYSPQAAVAAWYEEIDQHDFAAPDFKEQTGHFTQVVWRSSKQLGCGMALCRGSQFWVCRYSPPGNVSGQFSRNVPRPCL